MELVSDREEDIKNYFFRAARCQRIQAGLDTQARDSPLVSQGSLFVGCNKIYIPR